MSEEKLSCIYERRDLASGALGKLWKDLDRTGKALVKLRQPVWKVTGWGIRQQCHTINKGE